MADASAVRVIKLPPQLTMALSIPAIRSGDRAVIFQSPKNGRDKAPRLPVELGYEAVLGDSGLVTYSLIRMEGCVVSRLVNRKLCEDTYSAYWREVARS